MPSKFYVRDAVRGDLQTILAIYNDVIANTTAIYSEELVTIKDRQAWFSKKCEIGFPVLVAEERGSIIGFGSLSEFRPWTGYARSVEHSVHVRADQRRRGVGRMLVSSLMMRARLLGMHRMIGGVDAQNVASIAMHRSLGFSEAGTLHEVGYKFGRWLDLTFVECDLERH
jgi:L-amino acid N-acyltransferase